MASHDNMTFVDPTNLGLFMECAVGDPDSSDICNTLHGVLSEYTYADTMDMNILTTSSTSNDYSPGDYFYMF